MEQNRTHPLVLAAAAAVLVSSALAAGVLTGVLPGMASQAGSKGAGSAAEIAQAPSTQGRPQPAPLREQGPAPGQPSPRRNVAACATCGVVEAIRPVEVSGDASGVGAVAGGVTGAVVGNQFGRGGGRTAMTILGAAGGALAGNAIEKSVKKSVAYQVSVRMEDGSHRMVSQAARPELNVGERVRVVNGSILERV